MQMQMQMQALLFFYDILSTFLTSFALSLLLPFRCLICRLSCGWAALDAVRDSVSLYEGTVWHERRHPHHHAFRFSARYALIDLDRTPYQPPNHLSANDARKAAQTNGPVFLLAIPPSVGYQRSPVTIYYCYNLQGSTRTLYRCIVEVSNTPWVEKVLFSFDPNGDVVAKTLHVSPFMDMLGDWKIKTSTPGNNLLVTISVIHPQLGKYFSASLAAKQVSSSCWPADYAMFFWLMPHKAVIMTYWQAFKLWWKNVQFFEHPKYIDPGYIKQGLVREAKLQGCRAWEILQDQQVEEINSMPTTKVIGERLFTWREANSAWR